MAYSTARGASNFPKGMAPTGMGRARAKLIRQRNIKGNRKTQSRK